MKRTDRVKRIGIGVVVGLAALTIGGHFIGEAHSRRVPTLPPLQPVVGPVAPQTFTVTGDGGITLAGRLDRASVLQGQGGIVRMELTIAAAEQERGLARPVPTDLVVVLDRSGSMQGQKLDYAKAAIRQLLDELGGNDRFGLVTYSHGAEVAIPLGAAHDRAALNGRVRSVSAGGGTNMSSGLDLANRLVESSRDGARAARIILISDGLANQGDPTPQGLERRAGRAVQGEWALSTVGVGADFNEALMAQLADAGTGNYYYLRDTEQLATVFSDEFSATRTQVASAVEVILSPGPGVRVVSAGGYPLQQTGDRVHFRPGTLFAGQERSVWITYRVPHDRVAEHSLGGVALSWKAGDGRHRAELAEPPVIACIQDAERFRRELDTEVWTAGVIEESYNELQEKVAGLVQEGRKDDAIEAIESFSFSTGAYNQWVRSPSVNLKLDEAKELEAEVNEAFEGTNQRSKQNLLGKSRQSSGRDMRRGGSKYSSK